MPTFYNLIVCDYLILSHLAIKGVDIKSSSHFLFFSPAPFSLSVCPLSNCEGWGGESCLCPGPEEQLQHKPAKLTRSPWASHMHYSNQSILDHPDTLDIWGLCILLAVPICFTSPVFFFFFWVSPCFPSQWILRFHSCLSAAWDWQRTSTWHVSTYSQTRIAICVSDRYTLPVCGACWTLFKLIKHFWPFI